MEDLENQRQRLEQNVARTRAFLGEWKQWKLEYESLKKDLESLPPNASPTQIGSKRALFVGDKIDQQELGKIFGKDNSYKLDQIASTLVNRIDYVRRNISTLEKQLEAAESELAAVEDEDDTDISEEEYIPEEDYTGDDGGLPVTEIVEELDDDDNVLSYTLRSPGNSQPQLLEALEKAGLKELPTPNPKGATTSAPSKQPPQKTQPVRAPVPAPVSPKATPKQPSVAKKSVRFAEQPEPAVEQPQYMTLTVDKIDELMREAKEQEGIISDPVVPSDEAEEDAQLRRDMLNYNLSELNPVVAELTLEEGGTTDDEEGWNFDDDDEEDDYYDDDDEDEDKWGKSKSTWINDEYRQKMLEIEQRLRKHSFGTSGNGKEGDGEADDEDNGEGIATIRVKTEEVTSGVASASRSEPESAPEGKKSVRFASALDVAEEKVPVPTATTPVAAPARPEVDPLSDVVERKSAGVPPSAAAAPVPKKASRFKKARGADTAGETPAFKLPVSSDGSIISPEQPRSEQQFAPSGPEGQTMAPSVLERAPADNTRVPDEFDADMLKQQAAVEYHKVRNRMIHKQGGFMKEDESPIQPLDEEEGGPKRVSRFKAARLSKS